MSQTQQDVAVSVGTRANKHDKTRRNGSSGEIYVYNRVRLLRQERGLSQQALASEVGINHRTLGYLEREQYQPTISLAYELCRYFELPLEAIFSSESLPTMSEEIYGKQGERRFVDGVQGDQ